MDYTHLPVTMTVEQVARELQLERHTARKVIERSIHHIHLSAKGLAEIAICCHNCIHEHGHDNQ